MLLKFIFAFCVLFSALSAEITTSFAAKNAVIAEKSAANGDVDYDQYKAFFNVINVKWITQEKPNFEEFYRWLENYVELMKNTDGGKTFLKKDINIHVEIPYEFKDSKTRLVFEIDNGEIMEFYVLSWSK